MTGAEAVGIGLGFLAIVAPDFWPKMPRALSYTLAGIGLAWLTYSLILGVEDVSHSRLQPGPLGIIVAGAALIALGLFWHISRLGSTEPEAHGRQGEVGEGLVSAQTSHAEQAKPTLFLQCIKSALPSVVPPEGIVHIFSPMRQDRPRMVAMPRVGVPGDKWDWGGISPNWMSIILRCQITVYGDAPIFDVQLPVSVTLNKIERNPDGSGFRSTDSSTAFEDTIPIPKIDPGKDGFVFYMYHFEKAVAGLNFDKPPTYVKPGDTQRSEAILKQDPGVAFGHHVLWPAYDNLEEQLQAEKPKPPPEPVPPAPSPQGKQGRRSPRRKSRA